MEIVLKEIRCLRSSNHSSSWLGGYTSFQNVLKSAFTIFGSSTQPQRTRPMAKLADFPPEIFETIFSFEETSPSLITLWKCGNKRINMSLSRGCTHIDLLDTKWRSESIFPKLLLELRSLRSLQIDRGGNALVGARSLGLLLQNMSPTLEKLVLECKEAESCFLVSPPSESTITRLPNDYAPASIEKAGVCPNQSRFWDVSSIFPNLQSLELSVRTSFLTDVEMPFLPRTLTELRLSMWSWPKPSLLPPQLEILSCFTSYSLTGQKLAELPRSLRIIDARIVINSDTEWSLLPPALEKARFNEFVLSATNVSYIQALPLKKLGALTLTLEDSINAPWISQLPSTLKRLNFSSSEYPISSMVIKSLPRGIKSLLLNRIVGEDIEEGQNLFPPNLTSLELWHLPEARETCDILMKCLPQTLKSFITRDVGENLKSIELLPPSVTYCQISSKSASNAPIITLPQCIHDFNAYVDLEEEEIPIFVFPCCLTRLSISLLPSLELVKSLPQTLTELNILQPVKSEILDLLPSSLQILCLKIDGDGDVHATHFERMTVLKSLRIYSFEGDRSYFRGTFPASLRTIQLGKVVEHTKMLELPILLRELAISIDAELTNEIIQKLPRSLRSLRLICRGWSRVTGDAMQWHMAPSDIKIINILNTAQKFLPTTPKRSLNLEEVSFYIS